MAASPVVNINGANYDYCSLKFELAIPGGGTLGVFEGVSAMEYTPSSEREKFWGTRKHPVFATDGFFDADGAMTLARAWLDVMLDKCKQLGIGYFEIQFNIHVTYGNKNSPTKTDTLEKVKLQEVGQAHEQGASALVADLALFIEGRVLLNGVPPYVE